MSDNNRQDDEKLDEAIEETFPASDPAANTVEARIGTPRPTPSADGTVSDHPSLERFELTVSGQTAFLSYQRRHDSLILIHTEVPEALRGRRLGDRLVEAALDAARSERLQVVVVCPFAREYLRKHRS